MLDEEKLIEEAKVYFEEFLQKQQRSLATFIGDSGLNYVPDENLKKFILKPSKATLYLPLAEFLNRKLDEKQIMWHIYNELSLYPDWKRQTKKYLTRKKDWQKEIDDMTGYILLRIKEEGLEKDPAYNTNIILNYVRNEILSFLHTFDKYAAFLRVLQLCPIYRDEKSFEKNLSYLQSMPRHKVLINSFLAYEMYEDEALSVEYIREFYNEKIFNQPFFRFIRYELIKQINKDEGIMKRDPFVRSFVYPIFKKSWKQEIDKMEFYKSNGEDKNEEETTDSLEFTEGEIEEVLNEFLEQQERETTNIKEVTDRKLDLKSYGISQAEEQLFFHYSNKMKKEREEMKKFWMGLIGDAKTQVNVEKDLQLKGKINIDNFIKYYPDFLEAEKKGNYKDLPIFNQYFLESQTNILPQRIEISFVIDNSGSMNEEKIEATRKALAVTLLSIDDFSVYLKRNSKKLNQKIEVLTETWFFGDNYYNVKEFNNEGNKKKEMGDIIRSIVKLDGSDGSTDDASCLKEISKGITPKQKRELSRAKRIKLIFLITDGISNFPGASKEAVQELLSKNAEIYGFQIGRNSEADKKVFNFVWNDDNKPPRGVLVGEDIKNLPKELLKLIRKNMNSIFH